MVETCAKALLWNTALVQGVHDDHGRPRRGGNVPLYRQDVPLYRQIYPRVVSSCGTLMIKS